MDRLGEIFDLQRKQQLEWMDIDKLTEAEREAYIHDLVLYVQHELFEFLDARKYKRHKIWEQPLPRSQQVFELIDVQKYLIVLALAMGCDDAEWFQLFKEKTAIVSDRWIQDKAFFGDGKVIVCDIDDVLADYEGQKQALMKIYKTEKATKELIEEDHVYSVLDPIVGNIDSLRSLHRNGYHIILMTSRRAWRVASIQSDTAQWLRRYDVPYEAILWSYDKAEAIATRLRHTKPAFAIENSRKHAIDIADIGVPVYYLVRDESEYPTIVKGEELDYPNVVNIRSLSEIPEVAYERVGPTAGR